MSITPRAVLHPTVCACILVLGSGGAHGQESPRQSPAALESDQRIRSSVDLVTSDVIVRDDKGRFVSDLKQAEFDVYEDGVRQDVITFTLSHGGRIINAQSASLPALHEGIVLPPPRPTNDKAGRIFLLFIDDLHLDFGNTARLRALLTKISTKLIHEGDMFGVVSTGTSSIAINLTYDRRRLDEAIGKVAGGGLRPREILATPEGQQGSAEVRHRAHTAFSTASGLLENLSGLHDRRKVLLYVSNGYDFNPFPDARAKQDARQYGTGSSQQSRDPAGRTGTQFAFADLVGELAELTRAANRANASIYTIDPRGLVAGPDLDEPIDMVEWNAHVRTAQDTLRVLADQTGGFAVINQNDFDPALARIDAETGDYYVIGYYSRNPDPLKRHRFITVTVKRPGLEVTHRREYFLKSPAARQSPSK
jgi:VWFA-related protein